MTSPPLPPSVSIAQRFYASVKGRRRAVVEAVEAGLAAGARLVSPDLAPAPAGEWRVLFEDGQRVAPGDVLIELEGDAGELGVAEDYALGPIGFASGIATGARRFRDAAPPGLSVACGGWKKLPAALKPMLRAGLAAAGVFPRLVEGDFVYVGKNAVLLHGGVAAAVATARALNAGPVAIQVKSVTEARYGFEAGAGILMVDTGDLADLADVHAALQSDGVRRQVKLAFGGGVRLDQLAPAHDAGADAVDVGRAILNAPLIDLRLRVIA